MTQDRPVFPEPIAKILGTLTSAGFEAYLVGGCVRDWLRKEEVHDYDVTTNAHPESVRALFPHTIPTGIPHGTITVLCDGLTVEVTTYRREAAYSDGRHPDSVSFDATLQEDLSRRDFTINAMAMDLEGNLIDPYDGQRDLRNGLIRAVGDPAARFAEDGLRILRAIRFACVLEFHIEPQTLTAMEKMADNLRAVASERVGREFLRIAGGSWWTILHLFAFGPWLRILFEPWPQLQAGFLHLFHAQTPSMAVARELHKIRQDPDTHAPALAAASAALWAFLANLAEERVRAWLLKMAWDRETRDLTTKTLHLLCRDPANWTIGEWRRALFDNGRTPVWLASCLLDNLQASTGDSALLCQRKEACEQLCMTQPIWRLKDLAVSGSDLKTLGASGPLIGQLFTHLRTEVLAARLNNERKGLLEAAQKKLMELTKK